MSRTAQLPSVTIPQLNWSGICFNAAQVDSIFRATSGLNLVADADNTEIAIKLNDALRDAVEWGITKQQELKPSDLKRRFEKIQSKADDILEALGHKRGLNDPNDYCNQSLQPFYLLLAPLSGELPFWVGSGIGLLPRYRNEYADGCRRAEEVRPEDVEIDNQISFSSYIHRKGTDSAARSMLKDMPLFLSLLSELAKSAASGVETRTAGRGVTRARWSWYQDLAQIHHHAYGCWPRVKDAQAERNGPSVIWAKAIIEHATSYLRGCGAKAEHVDMIADLNRENDTIAKALLDGTKSARKVGRDKRDQ